MRNCCLDLSCVVGTDVELQHVTIGTLQSTMKLTEQFSNGLLASGVDEEAGAELVPLGEDCVGAEDGLDAGAEAEPGLSKKM